jgi:thiosulfate/3-mercaptopyruvate sulfurtransferase
MITLLLTLALAADPTPPLVSTAWLAQRLNDPNLVILQVGDPRTRALYDQGHIPGARFLNPFTELAAPQVPGGLTLQLPDAAQLDSVLELKGISDGSTVVVYAADPNLTPASRAFFTLEYAGLRNRVFLLDGGLDAWKRDRRPLSTEAPAPARGSFTPKLQADMVADAEYVAARLNQPGVAIIDARAPAFYQGAETRQARLGHLPGAANLPFNSVVNADGSFKPAQAIRAMLVGAGAAEGDTVVTYCHIGQQASLAWFSARMMGYQAKLYDGSMQEWSARRDLPLVAPVARTRDSLLVTPAWLHQHLTQPGLVVFHAERTRATYDTAHIPGARMVELARFAQTRNSLPTELPPVDSLVALFRGLGVGNQGRIVISGDPLVAARLFFTLDYLGHGDRTAILDGGLDAWRAAGHPVTAEVPTVAAGDIQPRGWPELVVTADWVNQTRSDSTIALIDARAADEFAGTRPDTTLKRLGHIPGSTNLDWNRLMDGKRLKPVADLRAMFEGAGAAPTDEVVATCATGFRASMLYFVARYLGYRTRMYDGAWTEWSRREELPVGR